MFTITPRTLRRPPPPCSQARRSPSARPHGQDRRTLAFDGSAPARRDVKQIDVRPRGFSIGDQFVAAITLRAGASASRRGGPTSAA